MADGLDVRLRHSRTRLVVHLVWATRARERCLEEDVDGWLSQVLHAACDVIGCRALAIGNASDHVHALVLHPPTVAVATVAKRLKGSSSRRLSHRFEVRWQAGYYAESIHDVSPVARYVREQRSHHASAPPPEPWESLFHPSYGTP